MAEKTKVNKTIKEKDPTIYKVDGKCTNAIAITSPIITLFKVGDRFVESSRHYYVNSLVIDELIFDFDKLNNELDVRSIIINTQFNTIQMCSSDKESISFISTPRYAIEFKAYKNIL